MTDSKEQPHQPVQEYYSPQQSAVGHDDAPPPYEQQQFPQDFQQSLPQQQQPAEDYKQPLPPQGQPVQGYQQPLPQQQLPVQEYVPPLPLRRTPQNFGDDDPSNPIHYTRDPHKLIGYLVPFPKPQLKGVPPEKIPDRFLIYTPPPPPLSKPAEGEKEERLHKVQRKWQEEVREAKTYTGKTASWKGVKSKATRGIDWAISQTTSANLDFINRLGGSGDTQKSAAAAAATPATSNDPHHNDGVAENAETKRTVDLSEMVLVYPTSLGGDPDTIRAEFINSMLRTQSKAQRDAVLATGLLPVSAAIDILATLVWPFGGLLEIDAVWAYSSMRGAKIARSTTKRLGSAGAPGADPKKDAQEKENTIHLAFTPSPRLEVLRRYLAASCHSRNPALFPAAGPAPTETEVLEAIGWAPRQSGGEQRNWEDEQWEVSEVKDDFKAVMTKGAREWDRWCKGFGKDPEKALKK